MTHAIRVWLFDDKRTAHTHALLKILKINTALSLKLIHNSVVVVASRQTKTNRSERSLDYANDSCCPVAEVLMMRQLIGFPKHSGSYCNGLWTFLFDFTVLCIADLWPPVVLRITSHNVHCVSKTSRSFIQCRLIQWARWARGPKPQGAPKQPMR